MKTQLKNIITKAMLFVMTATAAVADPLGSAFIYQGRVQEAGNPANGLYDLSFVLYDNASGGIALGTNALPGVAISNGLFTATLDFGSTAFDGNARWMDLSIRSSGTAAFTTLSPRQALNSTPYAIRAASAASAEGVIGPIAAGQLTGAISPANIAAGTISGSMLASGAVASGQLAAGAVTTTALADGAVTAGKIATVPLSLLLTTFTNPSPAAQDYFGRAIAAVGTDRVLIGASYDDFSAANAGIAYLFKTDGTLLATFTNPAPAAGDLFGDSVVGVGPDHVVISAYQKGAGVAYLFSTSGNLLTTFTNPVPDGSQFGSGLAALGTDRILISAPKNSVGGTDAGVVYLYGTNGTLLATIANPSPNSGDYFGCPVAALGTDCLLASAVWDDTWATDSGAVYVFNTNGVLISTLRCPSPGYHDFFGDGLAPVGNDRVLVGVPWGDIGGLDAGAAYLFHTNGTLLATFATPTPSVAQYFGYAVAAVGTDRVLIGEPFDETGAHAAGAAHLFTTNGTLLATFTNPKPSAYAQFGNPLAAIGTDRILIGSPIENAGGIQSGAAYLYRTEAESYTPGLIAEGVKSGSIATANLQDGAVTAAKFSGPLLPGQVPDLDAAKIISGVLGSDRVPNLDAAKLTSGTLADARLSTNVALLGANQVFTGSNRFAGVVEMTNAANSIAGTFSGDGSGLANLKAAQLTGTISPENIAAGTISGTMIAGGAVGAIHLAGGSVTTGALADGAVTAGKIAMLSSSLLITTFTNPSPAAQDYFGYAIAAMGTDRVLIGAGYDDSSAVNAGIAYLFRSDGTLLTTFTNPAPVTGDHFGVSVAALGTDRVLIGGPYTGAGVAYLFNTSGTLLMTFTNPVPAAGDGFGDKMAALGTDRVLIAAFEGPAGMPVAGVVYLFSTNGTLLTTFSSPTSSAHDFFGNSVATLGTDRVLIGATADDTMSSDGGVAYLFNTNGTLLATFRSPSPGPHDFFANTLAAVGTDYVLIGVPWGDLGALDAGAAYLFDTNGSLVTTFANPTPDVADYFGHTVTAVGPDRVVISAFFDNTGAERAGAAYVFSTNGTLLLTITNPAPAAWDMFGVPMAGLGNDRVLVGVFSKDTGATDAGVVHLFTINAESYMPGLIAEGVKSGSIATANIQDGAVTAAKISGPLLPGQVPDLDASKILSGVLGSDRVPNLDAAKLTSGTVADARLSTNVAMLGANQVFTGSNRFAGVVEMTNAANSLAGTFSGDGSGLTNLNASQLTGTISPTNIAAGTISGPMLTTGAVNSNHLATGAVTTGSLADGTVTAGKIGGVLLTNQIPCLDAAKISSGTLADARLSANVALRAGGNAFTGNQTVTSGSVGVGTASPASLLTVSKSTAGGRGGEVSIVNSAAQTVGNEAALNFGLESTTYNGDNGNTQIKARLMSSSDNRSDMIFSTWNGSTFGERMRLQSDGNVGIGEASPLARLAINGSGASQALAIYRPSLVLDQSNEASGAYYYIWGTLVRWQSFTAGLPAGGSTNLGAVEIYFGANDGVSPWTATLRIYSGVGSGGALLSQQTVNGQGGMAWQMCSLPTAVPISSGSNYTIYVTTGVSCAWRINMTDTYASGVSSWDSGYDFMFRTYQTTAEPAKTSLAVNSGNGFVGIGTASPASALHVKSAAADCEIGIECPDAGGRRWAVQSSGSPQLGAFQIIDRTAGASRLLIGTNGSVGIGTSAFTSNRLEVAGMVGATAFNTTSDRAAKQDFTAVDAQAVLAKVAAMPITQWSFKQFPGTLHLGPMAQDFRAAFGLGIDDKAIATVDADGVALAAIQGLNQKLAEELKRRDGENAELKTRLERLERHLSLQDGGAK